MQIKPYDKDYRSVPVPELLISAVRAYIGKHLNQDEAASALNITSRKVLTDALDKGKCSSKTFNKLLAVLPQQNECEA